MSAVLTAISFTVVGFIRGTVFGHAKLRSSVETLAIGGAAATLAYWVGFWLRQMYGI